MLLFWKHNAIVFISWGPLSKATMSILIALIKHLWLILYSLKLHFLLTSRHASDSSRLFCSTQANWFERSQRKTKELKFRRFLRNQKSKDYKKLRLYGTLKTTEPPHYNSMNFVRILKTANVWSKYVKYNELSV